MKSKKGFIGILTIFVLVLVVLILGMAQRGVDNSTINKTIETLNWSNIGSNVTNSIQLSSDNSPNPIAKAIFGIVNKAVDFFGYTIFEVSKLAMQSARDNPTIINYKVLLFLIFAMLLAPLIYPTFIIIVSLILIMREAIQNRRERKKLEILKIRRGII